MASPRVKHVIRGVDRCGPALGDGTRTYNVLTYIHVHTCTGALETYIPSRWHTQERVRPRPNPPAGTRRSGLGSFDACLFDLAPNEEATQARRLRAVGLCCPRALCHAHSVHAMHCTQPVRLWCASQPSYESALVSLPWCSLPTCNMHTVSYRTRASAGTHTRVAGADGAHGGVGRR